MIAAVAVAVLVGATALAGSWVLRRERASSRLRPGPDGSGVAPAWFGRALAFAEVERPAEQVWPLARWGALALLAVVALAAPIALGAGLVLVAAGVAIAPRLAARAAPEAYDREVVAAVEAVTASLLGGASLAQAVAVAAAADGAVGADLAVVAARARQGEALQVCLDEWAGSRPRSGAGLVADALALAGTSGGSRGQALAGVAATLRERAALRREVRALGSQARASALVLVITPIAFALVVALLDGRIAGFLLGTAAGWACLVLGLSLDVAGAWWMSRMLGALR